MDICCDSCFEEYEGQLERIGDHIVGCNCPDCKNDRKLYKLTKTKKIMAKKTIYKTVIQVTILSPDPYTYDSLEGVSEDIIEGDCSGDVKMLSNNEILVGKRAVKAVLAQGSDPEFFQMDENGNEIN